MTELDLTSLLAIAISLITLGQLAKNWSQFWDSKVTLADRSLATQLAVFVLLPLGVLLHEVGHSLATWQVGGTVKTFRWYFFSGYIVPSGNFSLAEYWWIVFAGNLVSILLGLAAIPVVYRVRKRIVAEILYFFALIQLISALIIYPLFSLVTRTGDWIQIYHLEFQPYAPFTLVAHGILLYKLWQLYHSQKAIHWRLSRNPDTITAWNQLKIEQVNRPNDLQPKLDLAYFLLNYRETHEANKIAQTVDRLSSDNRRVDVLKLVMAYGKKRYRQVIKSAQKLLDRDLLLEDRLRLYRILCISYLNTRRSLLALDYADRGLAIAPNDYKLLYNRALIYQNLRRYSEAVEDLNLALENCPDEVMQEWIIRLQKQCRLNLR